ncbi:MAG: hypothetical protein WA001_03695 [Patescibacteria group bacterium]
MIKIRSLRILGFLALGILVAIPAIADAGPYHWTDISSKLTIRRNRPIWAMAYANGNWFYSDGENFNANGQVYRSNGTTQVNITQDLRNALMSRVDDIVSDGQSVIFLQDMAPRNNQFTAIEYYPDGSYANVTSALRNVLAADEGIVQIVGRDGAWYISTSRLRIFKWDGGTISSPIPVSLPPLLQSDLNTISTNSMGFGGMGYCPDSLEQSGCSVDIVPISGDEWLFTAVWSGYMNDLTPVPLAVFLYDGTSFVDITASITAASIYDPTISSNGSTALFVDGGTDGSPSQAAFVTGAGVKKITLPCLHNFWPICDEVLGGKALWTGSDWLVMNVKQPYNLTPDGTVTFLGETRDYFVTGASNGKGTILLGGAVSEPTRYDPTVPLTAKLVKITDTTK